VNRASAHLCGVTCWFRCLFGLHHRPNAETRCRCCLRKAYREELEMSATRNHSDLTLRWWE
jgi:hypothetical protein